MEHPLPSEVPPLSHPFPPALSSPTRSTRHPGLLRACATPDTTHPPSVLFRIRCLIQTSGTQPGEGMQVRDADQTQPWRGPGCALQASTGPGNPIHHSLWRQFPSLKREDTQHPGGPVEFLRHAR